MVDEVPMFQRASKEVTGELRGDVPRSLLEVLDAVSMARDKTRMALVTEILQEWANRRAHEAMLVYRVTRGNPLAPDSSGGSPE